MTEPERFELRNESRLFAILNVYPDGSKTLDHTLTEGDVSTCPGVVPFDATGTRLMVAVDNGETIHIKEHRDSIPRFVLQFKSDLILDVKDSKEQVQLCINVGGPGVTMDNPLKETRLFGRCLIFAGRQRDIMSLWAEGIS